MVPLGHGILAGRGRSPDGEDQERDLQDDAPAHAEPPRAPQISSPTRLVTGHFQKQKESTIRRTQMSEDARASPNAIPPIVVRTESLAAWNNISCFPSCRVLLNTFTTAAEARCSA
ncbi:hypothetical protein BDZ85DRAFT_264420 [Elsinoe ampelina]|uniref:Uncharacterized protein n=1 Tax=Elsinoe ampelina TaxID=302913 RepID=A0A6A6G7Y9_9PEZI|nr:hypothetical protein BDZ85DRAFT_264420 [Elsinoe ampelina]